MITSIPSARLSQALEDRKQEDRLRKLRNVEPVNAVELVVDGKQVINFASNDYLGLSKHPLLKERAIDYVSRYGVGNPSSRLVSGNHAIYEKLEQRLAQLKGSEAALIFPSGFQLNSTVLAALARLSDTFFLDRLVHNSLLFGAKSTGKRFTRFHHNNLNDLKDRMDALAETGREIWIITESVFGMDGDLADLSGMKDIAKKYSANLYVDEAHATGVYGPNGMGISCGQADIAMAMGTFSKGIGCFGAYVACSKEMREFLINYCAGFIYTTALPPAVLGAIDAALELVPSLDSERHYLRMLAAYVRQEIQELGFDVGKSNSQIIPIIVGNETKALSLARFLEDNAILAPAIRPPTVEVGSARVRLSLSALHTAQHVEYLLSALKRWHD